MASYFSGTNGALFFGGSSGTDTTKSAGKKIGKVSNWSFQSSLQMLPTTSLGDTDETVIPGLRQQSGSFRLYYYNAADTTSEVFCKTVIDTLLKAQTSASSPGVAAEHTGFELRLQINDTTTSTYYVQGKVFLTNVSVAMSVGDVVAADCSFKVDGAFQQVTI